MWRIAAGIVLLAFGLGAVRDPILRTRATGQFAAQVCPDAKPMASPPALPFIDEGACPFEGCRYAAWTAAKAATIYDNWKDGRRTVGHLIPGQKVTGITGLVVISRPGTIRIDRDLPASDLKRGDTIMTYTYHGEGESAVWLKGRFCPDFDISFTKWPDGSGCNGASCAATYIDLGERVWWAKIKLKSGQTAWVNMNQATFDGIDALGS